MQEAWMRALDRLRMPLRSLISRKAADEEPVSARSVRTERLANHKQFLLTIFRGLLQRNGDRPDPGVLPWRAAHDAAKGLTEGALGLVSERLRDGAEAVRRVL